MILKRYIIIAIISSVSIYITVVEVDNYLNGSLHDMSRCQKEIADITMSLEKKYDDPPSNGFEMIFTKDMTEEQFQKKVDDCFNRTIIMDIPK